MQEDATQERVRELVRAGQLDFAGGGWVSNDEVCLHLMLPPDYALCTRLQFFSLSTEPACCVASARLASSGSRVAWSDHSLGASVQAICQWEDIIDQMTLGHR